MRHKKIKALHRKMKKWAVTLPPKSPTPSLRSCRLLPRKVTCINVKTIHTELPMAIQIWIIFLGAKLLLQENKVTHRTDSKFSFQSFNFCQLPAQTVHLTLNIEIPLYDLNNSSVLRVVPLYIRRIRKIRWIRWKEGDLYEAGVFECGARC